MSRSVGSLASCYAIGLMALWAGVAQADQGPGAQDQGADQFQGVAPQVSGIPTCFDTNHVVLEINNIQVEYWKTTTPNQFHSRAHVRGPVVRIYNDHSGHNHISVQIGRTADVAIELIYNQEFGALPDLAVGAEVETCGDYITSTAQSGGYPASPDGAIVHWVHRSTRPGHESGYVAISGVVYGY